MKNTKPMKRSAIKPKRAEWTRTPREERPMALPAKVECRGSYGGTVQPIAAKTVSKPPSRVKQAIRDSAKGEDCTVRLLGVCCFDPAKTIWSHARWGDAGKGRSIKALDLAGAYCCTACDAVYDGQVKPPGGYTREMIDMDWCMGHFRSLVRLHEKGLL